MPPVFDPRNYKHAASSSYTTPRLKQKKILTANGVFKGGIYGSTRVNDFLLDLRERRDSLDIVVVGDSNTGFTPTGDATPAGWVFAWEKELSDAGIPCYGSAVAPCANAAAANSVEGKRSPIQIDIYQNRSSGQSGGTAFVTLGSASGITAITNIMNGGGGKFRPQATGVDWAYTAAGTNQTDSLFIQVKANSTLDVKSAFVYRVGYVTFASGTGSFKLLAHSGGVAPITTGSRINTNTGTVGLAVTEMALAADAGRSSYVNFCRAGGGFSALDHGIYGPCGFVFESVYKRIKGWSVTSMGYYSGGTSANLKDGVVDSGETITTYLRELRTRQIAAGGSGRVLVFIHSGANDGAAITDWHTNTAATMNVYRQKWKTLGYPESDLCFMTMVSHPKTAGDDLAAGRILGITQTADSKTSDVMFVNVADLWSFAAITTAGWYDTAGQTHLKATGYEGIFADIINSIYAGS